MRAVEDDHFAAGRRGLVRAPQKVVGSSTGGGLLECRHAATLRVHRAQHVVDHAIFAAGVQGLQADEKGMAVLCVEQVLELAEFLLIIGDLLGRGLVALVAVREGGIDLLEFYFGSRRNFEPFQGFHLASFLRMQP